MTTRDDDLAFMGAAKLAALVRDKQVSPVELVRLYLDRIDRLELREPRLSENAAMRCQ